MKPPRLHKLPLHPLLVHFPVAGWTVATGLALLGAAGQSDTSLVLAQHANAFGLLTGAVAMVAGALELLALPNDASLRRTVTRHATLAFSAWLAYGSTWILQVKELDLAAAAGSVVAFLLLALAGHAGGRIVYHHGFPAGTGAP